MALKSHFSLSFLSRSTVQTHHFPGSLPRIQKAAFFHLIPSSHLWLLSPRGKPGKVLQEAIPVGLLTPGILSQLFPSLYVSDCFSLAPSLVCTAEERAAKILL